LFRLQIGDYRVIFTIVERKPLILEVIGVVTEVTQWFYIKADDPFNSVKDRIEPCNAPKYKRSFNAK